MVSGTFKGQDTVTGATDTTAYSYDGVHRLTGITYPSGISVGYGYTVDELTAITATVNGTMTTVAAPSGYQVSASPPSPTASMPAKRSSTSTMTCRG